MAKLSKVTTPMELRRQVNADHLSPLALQRDRHMENVVEAEKVGDADTANMHRLAVFEVLGEPLIP